MNINKEKQEKAFDEIIKISDKYEIDVVTVLDEDIYQLVNDAVKNGVEGADGILSKLNPEVCKRIRAEFNELLCEHWGDCLEQAINSQINADEETETDEGENKDEQQS